MQEFDDEAVSAPSEIETLKSRADMLGVTYHPSIGVDKLREKVASVLNGGTKEPAQEMGAVTAETEEQEQYRKRKEANELVRIRVVCMNPSKKEWDGEIITAGNTLVGSFTKYIPFNAEEGWHVPRIIYNQLAQRQCQIFVSVRDARGNTSRKGKLIKEFAIEVLPDLTAEELQELAQRQALSKAID